MKDITMKALENKIIPKNIKFAHRGLWDKENPENSLGAFKRARDLNISIELDLHILKDNTIVVFHDNNLKRMTGVDSQIKDRNFDEIKNLKLNNTEFKIPKFEDVLDFIDGKVLLDIEIKTDYKNFKICKEICKYLDKYKGDFLIKSFNPFYIAWFRIYRKNYKRGLLVSKLTNHKINPIMRFLISNMYFNSICKPDFISFNVNDLPNSKIEKLYRKGIPIYLWTIKNDEVLSNQYDGIIYEE